MRETHILVQGLVGLARGPAREAFLGRPGVSTVRPNLFLTTLTRLGNFLQRNTAAQPSEELALAQPSLPVPGGLEAPEVPTHTRILGRPVIDTASRRTVKVGLTLAQTLGAPDMDDWVPTSPSTPNSLVSVLYRVCLAGKAYEAHAPDHVVVSLDCPSAIFTAETFLASVHESLCASGLVPGQLELGLSESLLLDPSSETMRRLDTLKQWGVKLAVVDFGARLAPLACLERSNIESVVLAPSLVRAVSRSLKSPQYPLALIRAVVEAASFLDVEVVATGIETFDEFKLLQSLGCVHQQGNFFGPLVEAEYHNAWTDQSLSKQSQGIPGIVSN